MDDRDALYTPACELPRDVALRESCLEASEAIKEAYASLREEMARCAGSETARRGAEAQRDALLRARAAAQERWTECAAVTRDNERLAEQLEWFEQEVAAQRARESELRAKLHRLQSDGRVGGLTAAAS